MPTRPLVDPALAVHLHRDLNHEVPAIAAHFGVQPPCIYRAFRKQGYLTPGMKENRPQRMPRMLLPPAAAPHATLGRPVQAIAPANQALSVSRSPCFRCGVRGDIGCKCSKVKLGWRAG